MRWSPPRELSRGAPPPQRTLALHVATVRPVLALGRGEVVPLVRHRLRRHHSATVDFVVRGEWRCTDRHVGKPIHIIQHPAHNEHGASMHLSDVSDLRPLEQGPRSIIPLAREPIRLENRISPRTSVRSRLNRQWHNMAVDLNAPSGGRRQCDKTAISQASGCGRQGSSMRREVCTCVVQGQSGRVTTRPKHNCEADPHSAPHS